MASQFCERVGRNIKKYRVERGVTLKELAEKIGITEATMQKYEAGNIKTVSAERLKEIADAIGVEPWHITEWESKEQYRAYKAAKQGDEEARIVKMYSQLTLSNKKAVRELLKSLLNAQEKYKEEMKQ